MVLCPTYQVAMYICSSRECSGTLVLCTGTTSTCACSPARVLGTEYRVPVPVQYNYPRIGDWRLEYNCTAIVNNHRIPYS
jgi:hypothetical protein